MRDRPGSGEGMGDQSLVALFLAALDVLLPVGLT